MAAQLQKLKDLRQKLFKAGNKIEHKRITDLFNHDSQQRKRQYYRRKFSPGPDGLSAVILKSARQELCDALATIFNDFLIIGFVPTQWRASHITPIPKIDHPLDWSDHRPIAQTSNLCKAFEKVLVKYIIFKTAAIWMTNKQNGFLPGRSTMGAIAQVLFDIGKALDRTVTVLSIFFDLAKAFDLVPHDLLLLKLPRYLPPWLVRWIACYLSNRTQRVRFGNIETDWKDVEAGVIQGSVLGPVLFLLFVADINEYLPAGAPTDKYADDIISYIVGAATSSKLPQEVVDAVQRWCDDNQMRLNIGKCKVMHFKPKKDSPLPAITLKNTTLEVVCAHKYLGIELTPTLDGTAQWDRVSKLIIPNIYLLKQLKANGLRLPILINVFKSLVLSHHRYSSIIIVTCSDKVITELQALQNRLLRIIGISRKSALDYFKIQDVADFLTICSITQVVCILDNPTHTLTISLLLDNTQNANNVPLYHSNCTHRKI